MFLVCPKTEQKDLPEIVVGKKDIPAIDSITV